MRSSKTAGTLLAEMLMVRAGGWSGVFVVMEGPDDERFWRAHLRVKPEALVIAEGVRNLQECMRSLPHKLAGEVCAVADQDFRCYLSTDPFAGCRDVFFYDEGFLETFLLNTLAFRKLLGVHADGPRIAAFLGAAKPHTVYSHLRHAGSVIGRLRVLSKRHGWGLCFERKFTAFRYIDSDSWKLDEARLMADVATEVGWKVGAIKSSCDGIGMRGGVRLLHGHDALKILAIGLKKQIGSSNVGPRALFADLCLAFEATSLGHKRLTAQLRAWASLRPLI